MSKSIFITGAASGIGRETALLFAAKGWFVGGYDVNADGLATLEAEIGTPQWVFGMSRYGFLADGRMVFAYASDGLDRLAVLRLDGTVTDLDLPYTEISSVAVRQTSVVFVGAGFDREAEVVEVPIVFRERQAGSSKMDLSIVAEAVWRIPLLRFGRERRG